MRIHSLCISGLLMSIAFLLTSCVEPMHPYTGLAPGMWRAELFLDANKTIRPAVEDRRAEVNTAAQNDADVLPFLFEVSYTTDSVWSVELINGTERLPATSIRLARTRGDADKHLFIEFEHYDTYIEAIVKEGVMQGHFIVRYKDNYRIPFVAKHAETNRFHQTRGLDPTDFSGRWATTFTDDDGAYPAIGILEQDGHQVHGTFMTETGDYRYLSGIADGDILWLSTFDGAHAFLFRAKMQADGTLTGLFRSGHKYTAQWAAHRDDEAVLRDASELTEAIHERFSVTMPDEMGKSVTYPDPSSSKIKLVQILGTWCPNCFDETHYLKSLLADPRYGDHIEVMGIAFERYRDEAKARQAIKRYREKLDIPYPILYGGYYAKSEAADALPMLSGITSYPTLIVLDGNNQIRHIHTGFSGPATPDFEPFKDSFEKMLDDLMVSQ